MFWARYVFLLLQGCTSGHHQGDVSKLHQAQLFRQSHKCGASNCVGYVLMPLGVYPIPLLPPHLAWRAAYKVAGEWIALATLLFATFSRFFFAKTFPPCFASQTFYTPLIVSYLACPWSGRSGGLGGGARARVQRRGESCRKRAKNKTEQPNRTV